MTKFGPIGKEVYERTYSRVKQDGTSELWSDTVRRVVDGNIELAPDAVFDGERDALINLMEDFKIIPAGRHLWASGANTKLGLYNCHRAGWDETLSGHFLFTFDQLMLGGGVGANYSSEYLQRGPKVSSAVTFVPFMSEKHPDFEFMKADVIAFEGSFSTNYVVEDSREGWIEALRLVIEAHTLAYDSVVSVDVSGVRGRGVPIRGFGGIASGPEPLVRMLTLVNDTLNGLVGRYLTPLSAMEMDHNIASCVIAGNVRRSARMSILHWQDADILDFIDCKKDSALHWSTNISVEVDDAYFAAVAADDYMACAVRDALAEGMFTNGEPGVFNSSLASVGERGDVRSTNPCGEIALEEWEQCCLGHVNLAAYVGNHAGAKTAFNLMTRYLMRATLAESSDARQEAVKAANRRIGVGFFGFNDWAVLQGFAFDRIPYSGDLEGMLGAYRETVERVAQSYAVDLGINVPVKTTTVAPTGSIAKLPGVSEGLQPPYARYFIRRVRYAANDPRLEDLIVQGYDVEPCVYTPNTEVVSFVCRDTLMDYAPAWLVKQSDEISLESYFEVQAFVQRVWADNALSITGNFYREDTSVVELADLLTKWLPLVKGFTAMPEDGRPQSPYERLTAEEYEAAAHKSVGQAMDDCATGACPVR